MGQKGTFALKSASKNTMFLVAWGSTFDRFLPETISKIAADKLEFLLYDKKGAICYRLPFYFLKLSPQKENLFSWQVDPRHISDEVKEHS